MRFNTDTTDFRERMNRFASRGTIWGGKGRLAYKALVAEVNKLREEAYVAGKAAADAENNKNGSISPAILDIIRSQSKGE